MCGRFALSAMPKELQEAFGLMQVEEFPPRYNIAPTQPILIVINGPVPPAGSNQPRRLALLVRWGLLPGWVKDPKDFPLLINARSETAAEKAAFRAAMRHRRVLIPASGFYEWRRAPGKKTKPQAYWIRPRHGGIVAFGGLMETYVGADGSEIDTAAILTTAANDTLASIHDRMPVVIEPKDRDRWLDTSANEPRNVADLLGPVADDYFEAIPVSDQVNAVANQGPDLQNPVAIADPVEDTQPSIESGDQLPLF